MIWYSTAYNMNDESMCDAMQDAKRTIDIQRDMYFILLWIEKSFEHTVWNKMLLNDPTLSQSLARISKTIATERETNKRRR